MHPPPLPSYRATNGFLAVCTTYALFTLYLLWALLPSAGRPHVFTWLPDRQWATLGPSFLMVVVLATYASYLGLMAYNSPGLDEVALLVDPRSEIGTRGVRGGNGRGRLDFVDDDGPYDVPIGVINRRMFPPRPRKGSGRGK